MIKQEGEKVTRGGTDKDGESKRRNRLKDTERMRREGEQRNYGGKENDGDGANSEWSLTEGWQDEEGKQQQHRGSSQRKRLRGEREDNGNKQAETQEKTGPSVKSQTTQESGGLEKHPFSLSLRRRPSPTAELQDPGPAFPASCVQSAQSMKHNVSPVSTKQLSSAAPLFNPHTVSASPMLCLSLCFPGLL